MNLRIRMGLAGLAGVMASGCGPVVGTPFEGTEGAQGSTSDAADTSGLAAESGGNDESDGGTTGNIEAGLCGAVSASQPIGIVSVNDQAEILFADGSALQLDLPIETAGPTYVFGADAIADRVAIATGASTFIGDVFHFGGSLSMFDTDGFRLWTHHEDGAQISVPYLGEDGTVVAVRSFEAAQSETVMFVDGQIARTVTGFYPSAAANASGDVPGSLSADGRPGWWLGDSGALVGVSRPVDGGWYLRDGDGFVYVSTQNGVPAVIREQQGAVATWPVPAFAAFPNRYVDGGSNATFVVLVGNDDTGLPVAWARVEVASGVTTMLDLTPPPGWSPLDCYGPYAVLDGRGRVYRAARDPSSAQMYRLDPDSGAWDTIGRALTTVDSVSATVFGETVVVRADAAGQTFCPFQTFEPNDTALAGTSTQIVRPSNADSILVPMDRWPWVRPDGRCAATIGTTEMSIIDLDDDARIDVDLSDMGGSTLVWWR